MKNPFKRTKKQQRYAHALEAALNAPKILARLQENSEVFQNSHVVPMSSLTLRQPVKTQKSKAFWTNSFRDFNGDYPVTPVSSIGWENTVLTAEELSCTVLVPLCYVQDADLCIDLPTEIGEDMADALAKAVDDTVLRGEGVPVSWGPIEFESWDDTVVGLHKDMEFSVASEGVIQDADGSFTNLFQQNVIAIKATARIGFAVKPPVAA